MRALIALIGAAALFSACAGVVQKPPENAQLTEAQAAALGPVEPGALRQVAAFQALPNQEERSTALFLEMSKVLMHPRCVNCHPRTDRPLQGDAQKPHNPPVLRGADGHGVPGLQCSTCHGPQTVPFQGGEGSVPGHPRWHLAPIDLAWEGKTAGEICRQIKDPKRNGGMSLEKLAHHNAEDSLVGYGWDPGPGRQKAPGTQAEFGALTRAWIETGARCPS